MDAKVTNRIKNQISRRKILLALLDKSGYLILTFMALWISAMLSDYSEQFLTLAGILGMKWVWGSQSQVLHIFTHNEKEY